MNDSDYRTKNRLLSALPDADWLQWRPQTQYVELKVGQVLYEAGKSQRHAYFPTTAVVSLTCLLSTGSPTGISVVGNEGVIGTSLFLGGASTTGFASVLIAGHSVRIGAQMFREEFHRSATVRVLMLRYAQALLTQIAQTVICNRFHTVDEQVAGLLLHSLDRLPKGELAVTHQLIADMLGVRRGSVTEAARRLQTAGAIRYARGHLSVLDSFALERRSCACHSLVKEEYERLLPDFVGQPGRVATRGWTGSASDPAVCPSR